MLRKDHCLQAMQNLYQLVKYKQPELNTCYERRQSPACEHGASDS